MIVLLLFFCSGATALVYEIIWSKYLALLFGSTIQAQTAVLAVFMGGLALGNRWFGGRADRARRPLVIYGLVEIAIGLYAFCFPVIYAVVDGTFTSLGEKWLEHSGWLLLIKGIFSTVLLLGPTVLMGGTLPLLAAWLQQNTADAGRRSARFYAINSLGAVCGAGLAGFVLVQWLGMRGTLGWTAAANILIGLVAVGLGRGRRAGKTGGDQMAAEAEVPPRVFAWGCGLVALTGGVSMGWRCWHRAVWPDFGGIVAGVRVGVDGVYIGHLGGRGGDRRAAPETLAEGSDDGRAVAGRGGADRIAGVQHRKSGALYAHAQGGLSRTPGGLSFSSRAGDGDGPRGFGSAGGGVGIGFAAYGSGSRGRRTAWAAGWAGCSTWNTLGAVGGVLLTGFGLMPGIGLRGAFLALAVGLAIGALFTAWAPRRRRRRGDGLVGLDPGLIAGQRRGKLAVCDEFRGFSPAERGCIRGPSGGAARDVKLLFYEDAADATVSVENDALPPAFDNLSLRINGKPDASAPGDLSTQMLLGQLPLMMKPDSQDVFVLGMGSGVSAGRRWVIPSSISTVADNCEPVLRAAKLFAEWNHGVVTDPPDTAVSMRTRARC